MSDEEKFSSKIQSILRPARTIPRTKWTAASRWELNFSRFLILLSGLFLFGFGEALLFKANLGNSPWAVFAQGISKRSGISVGIATFFISGVVLLLWLPFNQYPGLGTICNMIFVAMSLQIGIDHFPTLSGLGEKIPAILLGIAMVGLGSGFYITCGLGAGPRDGLMTAIHKKTQIRVGRVRLFLELLVFLIGWLLGGVVGIGTALFALLIGNSVAFGFKIVSKYSI